MRNLLCFLFDHDYQCDIAYSDTSLNLYGFIDICNRCGYKNMSKLKNKGDNNAN